MVSTYFDARPGQQMLSTIATLYLDLLGAGDSDVQQQLWLFWIGLHFGVHGNMTNNFGWLIELYVLMFTFFEGGTI
jgi:hypothetical protein